MNRRDWVARVRALLGRQDQAGQGQPLGQGDPGALSLAEERLRYRRETGQPYTAEDIRAYRLSGGSASGPLSDAEMARLMNQGRRRFAAQRGVELGEDWPDADKQP